MTIHSTQEIIDDIRAGKMVVLVDAEDRENEGDIVMAADFVTPEAINFMATHARGLICMPVTEAHAARRIIAPHMAQRLRFRLKPLPALPPAFLPLIGRARCGSPPPATPSRKIWCSPAIFFR